MEQLQQIDYLVRIVAGSVAILVGLITAVVQIRRLPKGWHISFLRWAFALSPVVLGILIFASFHFEAIRAAACLMLVYLLQNAVAFAHQREPATRSSIAWFVLSIVTIAITIPTVLILDLLGRTVENQMHLVDTQRKILETQSKSIDVLEKLVGVPQPD